MHQTVTKMLKFCLTLSAFLGLQVAGTGADDPVADVCKNIICPPSLNATARNVSFVGNQQGWIMGKIGYFLFRTCLWLKFHHRLKHLSVGMLVCIVGLIPTSQEGPWHQSV